MLLSSEKLSHIKQLQTYVFIVSIFILSGCQISDPSAKSSNILHVVRVVYSVAHEQYEFYLAGSSDGMTLNGCAQELLSVGGDANEETVLFIFESKIMPENLIRIRAYFESYGYYVVCDEVSNGDWKYRQPTD